MCNVSTKDHLSHICQVCLNWYIKIDEGVCKDCLLTETEDKCSFKPGVKDEK